MSIKQYGILPTPRRLPLHPFKYIAPENIDQVLNLLSEYGERARLLAGGTDILVQTRTGRFDLDALIDLKHIAETTKLILGPEGLVLGAAVPCYQIYENPEIVASYPGITDAASLIGGIQIQSRASLGGNLCNSTPSADGICPLIVHNSTANIVGLNGPKSIPVEEFCTGPGKNILAKGEFLVSIDIPAPKSGFGSAYERFIPRNEMDIAVAGVASSIQLSDDGNTIEAARVALAAVGPTPIVAETSNQFLIGKQPSEESFYEAAELAASAASPIDDMRGDIEFRQKLVNVLTRRTLNTALKRARSNS